MRVSLVGIELLTIDARIMVAGVDTYLRFVEVANRLDIAESDRSQTLPDLLGGRLVEGCPRAKTKGAIEGAKEALGLADSRR